MVQQRRFLSPRVTVRAVEDVTFEIGRGEVLGLVGESGSGKSTLGRAVLRVTDLTEGRIVFDGQEVSTLTKRQLRPLRSRMQMIFQDPFASLNPRMTVGQIVAAPLKIQNRAIKRERGRGPGGRSAAHRRPVRGAGRPLPP